MSCPAAHCSQRPRNAAAAGSAIGAIHISTRSLASFASSLIVIDLDSSVSISCRLSSPAYAFGQYALNDSRPRSPCSGRPSRRACGPR
jgi:hypothetical protein